MKRVSPVICAQEHFQKGGSHLSVGPKGYGSRQESAQRVRSDSTMSLIVTIFALVFITELISWIGKSVLLHLAWTAYQGVFNRNALKRQRELKTEILSKKAELLQTSAQDQFAKWAKLRRSVDKGLADLEKLNSELSAPKSSFSLKFSATLWMLTAGLQFAIGWWYGRSAVFYLPTSWFGPFTWWLSFPFAPAGSVSCGVWQMACRRVIRVGERIVKEFINSYQEEGTVDQSRSEKSTDASRSHPASKKA